MPPILLSTPHHEWYYESVSWALAQTDLGTKYSPTFTVCGIPVDGGITTLALTFCFGIPVFTLRVFPTNESLCAEVITWKRGTKEALIYFGLKICSLKAVESCVNRHTHTRTHRQIKANKCTNKPGSFRPQPVDDNQPVVHYKASDCSQQTNHSVHVSQDLPVMLSIQQIQGLPIIHTKKSKTTQHDVKYWIV